MSKTKGSGKGASGNKSGGYKPLNEGYIPQKKGYTPSASPSTPKVVSGPKGGSGVSPTPAKKGS
jgi:hypothetical protein